MEETILVKDKLYKRVPIQARVLLNDKVVYARRVLEEAPQCIVWGVPAIPEDVHCEEGSNPHKIALYGYMRRIIISGNYILEYLNNEFRYVLTATEEEL